MSDKLKLQIQLEKVLKENKALKEHVVLLKHQLDKIGKVPISLSNEGMWIVDDSGQKNGLDMQQVRTFTDEDWSYVDTSRSLCHILKSVYCNDDHPENRVLSHTYMNCARLAIKFEDYILIYLIDPDTIQFLVTLLIDNIEKKICKKFPDEQERYHATYDLLMHLDVEVEKKKQPVPIWNSVQFDAYEQEMYRTFDSHIVHPRPSKYNCHRQWSWDERK